MRVCILGSGLSALTLAKALVNIKINVDLIISNKAHKINKSRTLGISKSNYEYFNSQILNIKKINWELKKIEILSDNLKDEKILNFENNKKQLFSIIKNSQLYDLLKKNLSNDSYFKKIKLGKKFPDINDYNLIINTDYLNSFTKKYFYKKIIKKYDSFAYTTIIKHEKILNDVATQIFTKNGPLAFLPVSSNETSIVYSIINSKNIKHENISKLINKYNTKNKIKKIHKIESFELKSLNLRSYYYKNILAFGDLLHRIHPLAGQGFNMTIRDLRVLIEIICEKISLGLPIDSSVGYQFEKNLKHKNYIFSSGIDLIYEFFNLERKLNSSMLSRSVTLLGKNHSINKMFINIGDKGIFF